MPFINLRTNVNISTDVELKIKKEIGKAIELLPGKSENWLMVNFSDNCHLYFRGENDTSICIVEVKLYGKSNASNYDALTSKISEIINKYLNISEDKIYVEYEETPFWGWAGSNF